MKNQLLGRNLEVISILRQNLIDSDYVGCCDNCGKIIVNIAEVKDVSTGENFSIGLDCKKTLIDKPKIQAILSGGDFMAEYEAKEYKVQSGHIEKFLKFCSYPDHTIIIDRFQDIVIRDNKPNEMVPEVIGNNVYYENANYLRKIGLSKFIDELQKSGKIIFER